MGNVFANGLEISGRAVNARTIAVFPDTCFTPPENPATPPGVPIPYPSFGFASDTEQGTGTAKIGGKTVNIKNKSDLSKTSGTEAGSAAKKGIITSKNVGKGYFHSWSSDVKFDGEPVVRHTDLATNNHASPQGNTVTWAHVAGPARGAPIYVGPRCPCCGGPAHRNQLDADGNLFAQVNEADYYEGPYEAQRDALIAEQSNLHDAAARLEDQFARIPAGNPAAEQILQNFERNSEAIQENTRRLNKLESDQSKLREALKSRKCPNIHDTPDSDCGTHLAPVWTEDHPAPDRAVDLGFTTEFKRNYLADYDAANGTDFASLEGPDSKVNHKTPIAAGGCPVSPANLIPDAALTPHCKEIDEIQTRLQGQN